VPLERLCLSPQCGFASTAQGNRITEADQWAKLERIVAVTNQDERWHADAGKVVRSIVTDLCIDC